MYISTELYRVFYKVAQHRSFSKAAEELFISQSAVSQSIKHLEQSLNLALLIRTTKQVSLTRDGEMLYTHLDQAFGIIQSAEGKLSLRQDQFNGQLVFAATDTLCRYFLLHKIQESTKKYPNIKFKIMNGTSIECMNLLKKAVVDFALINIPENLDLHLQIAKKYSFHDVFIAAEDYDIPDRLSLKEIASHPLLTLDSKSVTRAFLEEQFLRHKVQIQPEIELQNMDLLIDMAELGLGLSFVPDLYVKNRKVKVIQTKESIPSRDFGIISAKNLPLAPAAETFLALL